MNPIRLNHCNQTRNGTNQLGRNRQKNILPREQRPDGRHIQRQQTGGKPQPAGGKVQLTGGKRQHQIGGQQHQIGGRQERRNSILPNKLHLHIIRQDQQQVGGLRLHTGQIPLTLLHPTAQLVGWTHLLDVSSLTSALASWDALGLRPSRSASSTEVI